MTKLLCFFIFSDFLFQRFLDDENYELYALPSREFLAAFVATLLCRHSDNIVYCLVASIFWLDFINQMVCEFTELEYFVTMVFTCAALMLSKSQSL